MLALTLHDALPISSRIPRDLGCLELDRLEPPCLQESLEASAGDRKSTRLNSSHVETSYAVFCFKEKTNLSKQQQVSEIMRQMLTQAQTAGQYFTNDQIKEMTRNVSSYPTRRSSDLIAHTPGFGLPGTRSARAAVSSGIARGVRGRSEEHTSELQSRRDFVCRLLF